MPHVDIHHEKVTGDSTAMRLIWNREASWVQFKLTRHENPDSGSVTFIPEALGKLEATARPVEVVSDVLSRDDINELIRALRRARDTAYGADA